MSLDINTCDQACLHCIKSYKKKHNIVPGSGGKFKITCDGIPKSYLRQDLLQLLPEDQIKTAVSVMDPVAWAAQVLDWHCLDLDGSIWKRKNPEEYEKWIKDHPGQSIEGHSRYHRPYQATMLRCGAKYKVFRVGRQAGKTECLCVSILYNMFVKPHKSEDQNFTVIVITPFQTQIELIFKRLAELLVSNTSSIRRTVKAPNYTLELNNGSIIRGFTAGTKSAGNADSVRGQHGDMLVFDEADYLNSADIDSALSIITNHPEATIWMSSTPTGKRDKFYEKCNSKLYKEFHFPSQVNPMWNEELEIFFKENLTEAGYKHEILAEFGEQVEGVFQTAYVEAAKLDYIYGQLEHKSDWVYGLGVDWNDTAIGTYITVLGFNPTTNTFFIVDRAVVSREGWTQHAACRKIADLNMFWRPSFIYVDQGFGSTQIEILHKYGYDALADPTRGISHPDARLKDIVKAYEFGGTVEIHDLITKEPIKKAAKPFLVENAVRRFETRSIRFSSKDEVLEKQLLGYIIHRQTTAGVPIYKPNNDVIGDHALDSLMLALVGFTLEKTPFGKPVYNPDHSFMAFTSAKESSSQEASIGGTVISDPSSLNRGNLGSKPKMDRSSKVREAGMPSISVNQMPAANLNSGIGSVQLWAWPGWGHDAPKPQVSANRMIGRHSLARPKRRSF